MLCDIQPAIGLDWSFELHLLDGLHYESSEFWILDCLWDLFGIGLLMKNDVMNGTRKGI